MKFGESKMSMSSSYILDHKDESFRLEWQSRLKHYNLEEELKNLKLNENETLLDAGCGTGVVGRYLSKGQKLQRIDGCDFSELRINEAKKLVQDCSNFNFFTTNLENIDMPDESYNTVVSRYVFEHLESPLKVAKELYRLTKKGGQIYLIDLDGIFINLFTTNEKLNSMLLELKNGLSFDLEIGRKLPAYLSWAGFKNIEWDMQVCSFKAEELKHEAFNSKERCIFCRPIFEKIFKSSKRADEFIEMYLNEMTNPENVLFHNKFIVSGKK